MFLQSYRYDRPLFPAKRIGEIMLCVYDVNGLKTLSILNGKRVIEFDKHTIQQTNT